MMMMMMMSQSVPRLVCVVLSVCLSVCFCPFVSSHHRPIRSFLMMQHLSLVESSEQHRLGSVVERLPTIFQSQSSQVPKLPSLPPSFTLSLSPSFTPSFPRMFHLRKEHLINRTRIERWPRRRTRKRGVFESRWKGLLCYENGTVTRTRKTINVWSRDAGS